MHHLQRAIADQHIAGEAHAQAIRHPVDRLAGLLDGDRRQRRIKAVGGVAHQVLIHLLERVMHVERLGELALIAADEALAGRRSAADGGHLLQQDDLRAVVRRLDRRGDARAARADDDDIRGQFNRFALDRLGLKRRLERVDIRAGRLKRLFRRLEDRPGGHGRARHGVHRQALLLHDRRGNALDRRVADARRLPVGDDLHLLNLRLADRHGDLQRAADARALALIDARRHGQGARRQEHQHRQQQGKYALLHGSSPPFVPFLYIPPGVTARRIFSSARNKGLIFCTYSGKLFYIVFPNPAAPFVPIIQSQAA